MKPYDLCRSLLDAESEEEVEKIIKKTPELADPKNWHPLDDRETNFNVVTNQQSTGGKAAVELMTNMVDAVLIKAALEKGIDPKGPKAPQTMYEAVKDLVKEITVPRLVDEDERVLLEYARRNLVIGITGKRSGGYPCYTFADNGEGQHPEDFAKTFCSLSARNKSDIPFVHGRYNMGSSGVLNFCGRHWFKLIVSRKYEGTGNWGFTLVRRRPRGETPEHLDEEDVAEYFRIGDEISTFDTDMLYPFRTGDGKTYDGFTLNTGTVIKLYDFQIGKQFRSFRGSREAFNENLVETMLPFRLLDFRWKPDPTRGADRALGVDARRFYGMEYLILREHADSELEDLDEEKDEGEAAAAEGKLTVDVIDDPELGHIEITVIPLKRGKPKWLQVPNNHRVFHFVNGQVHFKQTRGFLTSCGLPALKDRAVILVDATNLKTSARKNIWKGDRESILETIPGERYKAIVREAIERSATDKEAVLSKLQNKIAKEELTQAANKQNNELFQQLVDKDPQIANLLRGNNPSIISIGLGEDGNDKEPYDGEYSPTVFELEKKVKESGAPVPINKTRPVVGLTDVENGYLVRADNKGKVIFSDDKVREYFTIRQSLNNGRLVIYFTPVEGKATAGMMFKTDVGLFDPGMAKPVTDKLELRIEEPGLKPEPNPSKPKKPKKTKEQKKPNLGLPPYKLLTKDGRPVGEHPVEAWTEDINDYDGGLIVDFGEEGTLYKINHDNAYHLKYRSSARGEVAKDAITEKYVAGMRLILMGLEHAFREGVEEGKKNGNGAMDWLVEYGDEIKRLAARGSASTVLALAEHLPKIAASPEDEPE